MCASKEMWTDDRCWYPFNVLATFGPKKKGLFQILTAHVNEELNAVAVHINQGTTSITMRRFDELLKMAEDTYHLPLLKKAINIQDSDGESALTEAIRKKSLKAVKFLVKHGADVNQQTKDGSSVLYLADHLSNTKEVVLGKLNKMTQVIECSHVYSLASKKIKSFLIASGAIDIPPEIMPRYNNRIVHNMNMQQWMRYMMAQPAYPVRVNHYIHQFRQNAIAAAAPSRAAARYENYNAPQPPKRLSAKEYRMQFAGR